jgi:hypothetical protein
LFRAEFLHSLGQEKTVTAVTRIARKPSFASANVQLSRGTVLISGMAATALVA